MSLLKTALACVLLAVLAPWADAQMLRPASSKANGQISSFGGYPSSTGAMPMRAAAPRSISYNASQSASPAETWTSDSEDYEDSAYDASEVADSPEVPPDVGYSKAPQYQPWQADTDEPDDYNGSSYVPGAVCSGGSCQIGAGCSSGSCSDPGQSNVSSWMGAYRFGGGNMGFQGPWYLSADAFLLHRSNGNANIPITLDNTTGSTLLSAQDLKFSSRVGPRLMIGYAWSHTTAFELSYWGLIDPRTQRSVVGSSNLTLPGSLGLVAPDFFDANSVNVSYSSRFNNAEFNVLRNTGNSAISWLYGFRYFGMNDHLDITSQGGLGTANYAIVARNNMYGIQGGGRLMLNYKNFALETTLKAGVLENATQQAQHVTDTGLPFTLRDTLSKGANVSFLGEVGLNAIYKIGDHWAIRGGYTLIWVDGLALAPNQLDYTFNATSGMLLNHGGNLLMQAVSTGVEFHW